MIKHNDFGRMWIVIPESLQELLRAGRVLTCSHRAVQFALTHHENANEAFTRQAQLNTPGCPAYVLLLSADNVRLIAAGEATAVFVLDGAGTAIGKIRLTGEANNQLRTEYGLRPVESIVLSQLKDGDLFAISERDTIGQWLVYRALNDGAAGLVEAVYQNGQIAPPRSFEGHDQVVFKLVGANDILEAPVA